ncbi:unnamed protein product [Schistosoma curassoni]|uniref:Uncharacterized protein n=1 Tax=Schistosoma curassoni TaxID=6186 RepID=A0A183JTH8_9TREM|nr:unnamed protein product [Schistosoma curassoni]
MEQVKMIKSLNDLCIFHLMNLHNYLRHVYVSIYRNFRHQKYYFQVWGELGHKYMTFYHI